MCHYRLKAVSRRTLGMLDAGSTAGLEVITKVTWYYLHERVWAAIAWGRR